MEFFDELRSANPPDCKPDECCFVPLGYFLKIRQIQNGAFWGGALIEKGFDVIKYSQIIHC